MRTTLKVAERAPDAPPQRAPTPAVDLVESWRPRPVLATAVGVLWYVVPVVISTVVVVLLARTSGRPEGLGPRLAWIALLCAVSSLVLWAWERAARRLLGLRALLRLGLAFPGATPSRFAVALRGGSTRQLEHVVRDGAGSGGDAERDSAVTLLGLVAALSAHDPGTRGHSERVRAYTELIAEELGLDRPAREALRWGGLIHDIGKLRVPAHILNKTTSLTEEEWEIIRRHPADGAALAEVMSPWLGEWTAAVLEHHERWEGGGYPRGLAGTDISLAGRIVAVADAFDVMTSTRSYKPPRRPQQARAELVRCAGSQFDPMVVRAFLNVSIRRIGWIMGAFAAVAPWPVMRWRLVRSAQWLPIPIAAAAITGVAALSAPPAVADPATTPARVVLASPARSTATGSQQTTTAADVPSNAVQPPTAQRSPRPAPPPRSRARQLAQDPSSGGKPPKPTGEAPKPSKGPDPARPAKDGLCNAYAHNADQAKQGGQAFQNLAAAGAAVGQSVQAFCDGATPGGS